MGFEGCKSDRLINRMIFILSGCANILMSNIERGNCTILAILNVECSVFSNLIKNSMKIMCQCAPFQREVIIEYFQALTFIKYYPNTNYVSLQVFVILLP